MNFKYTNRFKKINRAEVDFLKKGVLLSRAEEFARTPTGKMWVADGAFFSDASEMSILTQGKTLYLGHEQYDEFKRGNSQNIVRLLKSDECFLFNRYGQISLKDSQQKGNYENIMRKKALFLLRFETAYRVAAQVLDMNLTDALEPHTEHEEIRHQNEYLYGWLSLEDDRDMFERKQRFLQQQTSKQMVELMRHPEVRKLVRIVIRAEEMAKKQLLKEVRAGMKITENRVVQLGARGNCGRDER